MKPRPNCKKMKANTRIPITWCAVLNFLDCEFRVSLLSVQEGIVTPLTLL